MMTIAIKIELSNLDKAMTEIKALENMVLDLSKSYPTKFAETPVVEVAKPKTTRKTTAKKPTTEPKTAKEPTPEPEPAKDVKPAKEPSETISLEELTALAKETVGKAGRDTVKETVEKFSETTKLSGVLEEKRTELAEALKAL